MYQLMIVDDNPYTCKELMEMFDWESLNIEVMGYCSNGMKALAFAQETPPDIILADIRMPVLSGIDFAAQIREKIPDVKVIFMSNYTDFDYSKNAIRLGAAGYILKPVDKSELLNILLELTRKMNLEHTARIQNKGILSKMNDMLPASREHFLRDLLFGLIQPQEIEKQIEDLSMEYIRETMAAVILLKIQDQEGKPSTLQLKKLARKIDIIVKEAETIFQKTEIIKISSFDFAILFFDSALNKKQQELKNYAEWLVSEMISGIEDMEKISAMIGISNISVNFKELHTLYRQAYEALDIVQYSNSNPVVNFGEIDEGRKTVPEAYAVYSDIKKLVRTRQKDEIEDFLEKYYPEKVCLIPYARELAVFIANTVVITAATSTDGSEEAVDLSLPFVYEEICRQKSIQRIKKWLYDFLCSVLYVNEQQCTSKEQDRRIALIKKIIHEKYSQQISIQEIANSVFFSAGYANATFKKETGYTIFDYLQHYRMQVAKELLSQSKYKIYDIAKKVGYINATHFSLTFKKLTGVTPVEFRNKVTGETL